MLSYGQNYLLAGVVRRTISRIRTDVEEKINRLPLGYVDRQPRGDLLSRVTNDIDNVAQSLQQTLGQMLTSLLTIFGVLVMMFVISPILALVALVTIPSALFLTKFIAPGRRSASSPGTSSTGTLNAQVETFTGHALVKVFGRQADAEERFNQVNDELYQASFGAQFISGISRR
ncbi:MAG: ABC transporter ATP-binding protein [Microthrixaceae bacterium]